MAKGERKEGEAFIERVLAIGAERSLFGLALFGSINDLTLRSGCASASQQVQQGS